MAGTAVYICDCMGGISDHLDMDALVAAGETLDDVVAVKRVGSLCTRVDLEALVEELRGVGASRLLFAGCSPRMSLQLPEALLQTTAEAAGIDPARVEVADIRELCAWLHRDDPEGASAKARDMLRMAHARLSLCGSTPESVLLEDTTLVIGGGPAGLAAARDLARARMPVVLVEELEHLGGKLCQLPIMFQNEAWPSVCESSCTGPVQALEVVADPNVTVLTEARVEAVDKVEGNFRARIAVAPRYVDPDRCISCGKCEEVCPEEAPNLFERGLAQRKAISKPFERAVPDTFTVLDGACTRCGDCVPVCPTDAIDLDAWPSEVEVTAGAVILATGSEARDLSLHPELGADHADVITSMDLERLLARGLERPSDGEEPEHVVFVQCAGSRAGMDKQGSGVPYCSRTCCSVTAKQAKRVAAMYPMTEVSIIYYRDFRTYERALEKLHQDVVGMGLEIHNGEVTSVNPGEEEGLVVSLSRLGTEELEDEGATQEIECDLVVLACAQQPNLPRVAVDLGMPLDAFGFPIENQPRIFRPTETFVDRVFAVGSAAGPKAIQPAVGQGSTAALKTLEALRSGAKQPPRHVSAVDQSLCTRCGVCISVCPHGAVRGTPDGAVVDAAFCQACGMCAASCPSHAAQLHNFTDEQLLAEAAQAFTEVPAGEPRILAMLCYWCAQGGADLAGIHGLTAPSCLRTVRIRCSSSVNLGLVTELYRMGVDGIIVAGCPPNSCHHMWGNWLADKRTALFKTTMRDMGLDERRLRFDYIGIMNDEEFVQNVAKMREALLQLGPHPWAAGAVAEGGPAWR